MCSGAVVLSRLKRLVFGAMDAKAGAAGSLFIVPQDRRLNHFTEIIHGVEESHAAELLDAFFQKLRDNASPGPG
jgi:tRNA(adenine34) deaminase